MSRAGAMHIVLLLALVLVGALAGATLNFVPAFLAIPIALVVLGAILVGRRRSGAGGPAAGEDEAERNRLGARRIEFSERDRRTLS